MHQVEKLQSYFRLRANKPEPEESYLPTPYTHYVLIFNDSNTQANNYGYFTDVAEYLLQADPNLNIVQIINSPAGERIPHAYHATELSHNQLYFLVKNADLVITSDNLCAQVCGVYDKPLVCISGNSSPHTARPFFNNEVLHSTLCTEKQPSYASTEQNKSINKIYPEAVARSALKKLDISDPTPLYKTIYVGPLYRQYLLDYIPDFKMGVNIGGTQPITARLDLEDNIHNASDACRHSNLHTLCINKEVNIENLFPLKNKIKALAVEVNMEMSVHFIKEIHKFGCEVTLHTKDSENINDIRVKFIDWVVRLVANKDKPDLPKTKQLFYKSTKLTMSKGKKFTSLASRNTNCDNSKVIDNKSFWAESDHFLIYSLD